MGVIEWSERTCRALKLECIHDCTLRWRPHALGTMNKYTALEPMIRWWGEPSEAYVLQMLVLAFVGTIDRTKQQKCTVRTALLESSTKQRSKVPCSTSLRQRHWRSLEHEFGQVSSLQSTLSKALAWSILTDKLVLEFVWPLLWITHQWCHDWSFPAAKDSNKLDALLCWLRYPNQ